MPERRREKLLRNATLAFGVNEIAVALFITIAPHAFFDTLGGFESFNLHYLHDAAAFEGALGIGLLIAAPRPAWRLPMLAIATAHFGLHTISHGLDVSDSDPSWAGYFDFFALLGATATLAWLTSQAARQARQPAGN